MNIYYIKYFFKSQWKEIKIIKIFRKSTATAYLNILIICFILLANSTAYSNSNNFNIWIKDFKKIALRNGISENTFNEAMKGVKFLPKVIEYDRFQPEFYEDTNTYITKRTSDQKVKKEMVKEEYAEILMMIVYWKEIMVPTEHIIYPD